MSFWYEIGCCKSERLIMTRRRMPSWRLWCLLYKFNELVLCSCWPSHQVLTWTCGFELGVNTTFGRRTWLCVWLFVPRIFLHFACSCWYGAPKSANHLSFLSLAATSEYQIRPDSSTNILAVIPVLSLVYSALVPHASGQWTASVRLKQICSTIYCVVL